MDMMPTDISSTLDISIGKIIFAIDFLISDFDISDFVTSDFVTSKLESTAFPVFIFALCQNYFGPLNSLAEKEKYARFDVKKTTKRWRA